MHSAPADKMTRLSGHADLPHCDGPDRPGETIEERCFSAALVCLEGHYTHAPPMGPQTAARVSSIISRTLERTHTLRKTREALSRNVAIWIWLTRIFAAAIPSLTARSVGPLSSLNDPDKGVSPQESTALIVMNHASIKEDLGTLIKLMHIARNLLVNAEPEVPQDICAAVHFDQMVYQTIILCVNVTSKGYDGEILDEVQRLRLADITELYKKLLVTALQQAHNWTAKHDRNKMSFWFDVLFDDNGVCANDAMDGGGFRQDVAKHQVQHWLDRNSRLCDTARRLLKDYSRNHADKPPGNLAPIRPLAWNWLPEGSVDVTGLVDEESDKINPVWNPNEPDIFERDRAYGRVSREVDTWWLRARDPNYEDWVVGMPTTDFAKTRAEHCRANLAHRYAHSYTAAHSPLPEMAEDEYSDHEHCPECHARRHGQGHDDGDEEEEEEEEEEDDDEEDQEEEEEEEEEGEEAEEEEEEDEENEEGDEDHEHVCHHDHNHDNDQEEDDAYCHEHCHEHDQDEYCHDQDDDDDLECDHLHHHHHHHHDDGHHHHHCCHHHDDHEYDDMLDDVEADDDESYGDDLLTGLLTEVPNILDPKQIEALHMIVKSCILDTAGSGLTCAGENLQKTRCRMFLALDCGKSLLREMLVFIAVWEKSEQSLIFQVTTQIVETLHHSALIPYAWNALRISKDIISPAQAVLLRLVNHMFRARVNNGSAAQTARPKDSGDLKLVHFFFSCFRSRIVPEITALMHLQGQIREEKRDPSEFPVDSWDMERAKDGLAQYLDFLTTVAEMPDMRVKLIEWEAVYDLVAILVGLEAGVAKKPLVELPKRSRPAEDGPRAMVEKPYSTGAESRSTSPAGADLQEPAHRFPWPGLKAQIFTILATMLQPPAGQSRPGNADVQAQMVKHGGIVPLLNSCVYDDHNPFAKERVTICLKWLLDGCEAANRFLKDLVSLTPQPEAKPQPGGTSTVRVDGIGGEIKVQVRSDGTSCEEGRAGGTYVDEGDYASLLDKTVGIRLDQRSGRGCLEDDFMA